MSRSASKVRDIKSSVQKEIASFKKRRAASVDTRARGSYVPDKNRASSEERKSGGNKLALRWGGARKSSINLGDAKRKDGRPLTDRAYQKRKACELAEFLEEIGFNPPISSTKLMAPSKKDFENIFQFLYKFFDPTYEVKRIEEEGPKILKNLCYPFTVNKSAFVYVARTNWPSLLGVLIWLMDLNKYAMKIDMKNLFETAGDDERAQIHKIVLRYICQCHHSGNDNEEEEIAVFTRIIKSCVTENMDELNAKNEEKKLMIQSVEDKINELKLLSERDIQFDKKIQNYEEYILQMQTHFQKRNEICEQQMEELKEKESEYKTLQEQVTKLQDAYDAQGFDGKKHLNYFETQMKELSDKLERKKKHCKEMQDKYHEAEIRYNRCLTEISDSAYSAGKLYGDRVESFKTIMNPLLGLKTPQVQNVLSNFQLEFPMWEVQIDKYNAESNKAFRNAIENIAEKVKSTKEIFKRICASMNQKLTELELKKSDVSTKLKLLSFQENKQEQDLDSRIKVTDDEMSTLEAQCEKLNQTIKFLQDEKSKYKKIYDEMVQEKNTLIDFQEKKKKQLKEYLTEQKERFAYFEKNEEKAVQLSEAYGNEIATTLEELKFFKTPA